MSRFVDARAPRSLFAADDVVISRADAQQVIDRVLRLSTADAVQAVVRSSRTRNVRFAANQLSTAGVVEDTTLVVMSYIGKKHSAVTTNDLSPESVERTVRKAEAIARLSPDDPELLPLLGPQQLRDTSAAWDEETATLDAGVVTAAANTALAPARRSGSMLSVAGFLVTGADAIAIGNSAGHFAYHRGTNANYTLTVRTDDGTGSGWSGEDAVAWKQLDFAAVSAQAIEKSTRSRNPVAIEPGRYTVILEPQAVGDLVGLMPRYFNARSADEGRSPFSKAGSGNRLGERIVASMVNLVSDPFDPLVLTQPFDGDGLPLARQSWITNGVLSTLLVPRSWGARRNLTPTGTPNNIMLGGGSTTREQMIAGTERGVLVTRLWYLRETDPRAMSYTGLTRDGTFLIENGKITRSIKNMRFNESPLFLLNNVEALGPVRRTASDGPGTQVMPVLKARDFNFTSLSEAV
ncbi:MAG: TldD/PmbA family protein [Gemmatimonadaceae bacterium]|jgi:predicted Zn-dependent protease|nr:TldD/PmbA family protein [Gemmatimonadaceae bacterium]